MCYLIGSAAHLGRGKYDAEIARGACRIGVTVVGGASKLWKHIIEDNPHLESIVYYVDLNYYDGGSLQFLSGVERVSEAPGLKNYWVDQQVLKNREPGRHKEIMELAKNGKIWQIWDAGVQVNVWRRSST